jgi:hypothetical protein
MVPGLETLEGPFVRAREAQQNLQTVDEACRPHRTPALLGSFGNAGEPRRVVGLCGIQDQGLPTG